MVVPEDMVLCMIFNGNCVKIVLHAKGELEDTRRRVISER